MKIQSKKQEANPVFYNKENDKKKAQVDKNSGWATSSSGSND
ncbi:hypothetical protein [Salinibacillus kushneri]|nr:hypothetical protein [Salinibacillus kushneri]